jgi:hypothetical protein
LFIVFWEGESFEPAVQAAEVVGLSMSSAHCGKYFLVHERAHFEFAVTESSLREVADRNNRLLRAVGV